VEFVMTSATYMVFGMSCDHCVHVVTTPVRRVPGVTKVDVDLASQQVVVTSDEVPDETTLRAAIADAGYERESTG
jgi:copper chaperone